VCWEFFAISFLGGLHSLACHPLELSSHPQGDQRHLPPPGHREQCQLVYVAITSRDDLQTSACRREGCSSHHQGDQRHLPDPGHREQCQLVYVAITSRDDLQTSASRLWEHCEHRQVDLQVLPDPVLEGHSESGPNEALHQEHFLCSFVCHVE